MVILYVLLARCQQNVAKGYQLMLHKNKAKHNYIAALVRASFWWIIALLLLHYIGQFLMRIVGVENVFIDELSWRFNVDLELNVPTWYASAIALIGALAAWYVAMMSKIGSAVRRAWRVIALGFLFVSIDETASFHELILQTVHMQANLGTEQSYASNAWLLLLPLIISGAVFVLWYIYRNIPRIVAKRLIIATIVYLLGALVIEYASIPVSDQTHLYNFVLTPLEEGLEMLGMWLAVRAVLLHIADQSAAAAVKTDK
jgi:hypothetical protein